MLKAVCDVEGKEAGRLRRTAANNSQCCWHKQSMPAAQAQQQKQGCMPSNITCLISSLSTISRHQRIPLDREHMHAQPHSSVTGPPEHAIYATTTHPDCARWGSLCCGCKHCPCPLLTLRRRPVKNQRVCTIGTGDDACLR